MRRCRWNWRWSEPQRADATAGRPLKDREVEVSGRLARGPARLYEFDGAASGPIRQNIDVAALSQETGLALLDVSVLQTGDMKDGLQRNWPSITAGVQKHHGYAFQWFGLCALAGILYVWFQFLSPRRKRTPNGTDA